MKELIETIQQHPSSEIAINGFNEIIATSELDEETILYFDAKRVLESVFEGMKLPLHDSSGDPQLETSASVSGKRYIEIVFNNNYDEALEYVVGLADS